VSAAREVPAEQHAVELIRSGKVHNIAEAADESGLEVAQVIRALVAALRAQRPVALVKDTGAGWEPYLRHPSPRVVKAAERLRDVFELEDGRAQLVAERQRLEAQLARVKAQLRGGQAAAGSHECGQCGKQLPTEQGLRIHTSRKHSA
jgi:hypothetical protein